MHGAGCGFCQFSCMYLTRQDKQYIYTINSVQPKTSWIISWVDAAKTGVFSGYQRAAYLLFLCPIALNQSHCPEDYIPQVFLNHSARLNVRITNIFWNEHGWCKSELFALHWGTPGMELPTWISGCFLPWGFLFYVTINVCQSWIISTRAHHEWNCEKHSIMSETHNQKNILYQLW